MNTIRVSATAARNNLFGLLDQVAAGISVIVEKDKKTVAHIIPVGKTTMKHKGLLRDLKKAAQGFVYTKKDNPLRKPGAMRFLQRWD